MGFKRLWQACCRWWQRVWQRNAPVSAVPPALTLDPVQAESILMELLAGIAEAGWNRAAAQAFLIQKSCSASTLATWLEQFGAGLEPGHHDELAHRLQQLAHLQYGDLSQVAAKVARHLHPPPSNLPPAPPPGGPGGAGGG
ncbi:MAG: hypothetical protein NW224_03875, partial [Leptolyngbyaceae cyanobacterium bins.302]|nr:hypothetical protein [Leptolyngbyaceae cyanobacterium bins.302]